MKYRITHHTLILVACFVALAMFFSIPVQADEGDGTGIIFLQLHIAKDTLSLVKSTIVSGTVKQPRVMSRAAGIYYEVESESDSVIASGIVDDPLIRHLEYEDPDNPGTLKSKVVQLTETDFVLRLRYSEDIESVSFYRMEAGANKAGERVSQEFLGKVSVDLDAGGEK